MSTFSLDRRSILLIAILPSFSLGMVNQFYLETAYQHGIAWFYLMDASQWVLIPFLVWLSILSPANIKPKDYGLSLPILGARPLESIGLFLFVTFLLWFVYKVVHDFSYFFLWKYAGVFGYGAAIPSSFPWNALVIFYYSLTAAFVEEIVFRGLPWLYFSSAVPTSWQKFLYITVTSILFAATHSEQGLHGMIAALSFGLVSATLYMQLRDLWPLVFGHFLVDVISFWPK